MKTTIKPYVSSLLFILFSTFICSFILAILNQNKLISITTTNILTNIMSILLFFIASIILGMKIKKKGLINGIILSLIYISLNLIIGFNFTNYISVIKFISKIFVIILGAIIGVNLSN